MTRSFLQDPPRAISRISREGPSCRNQRRQHFFDPTGTNTITISDRIEKTHGSVAGNHRQYFFDPTGSNTITISDRIETSALFFDLAGSNTIAINDW